jgi:hypothetical protein
VSLTIFMTSTAHLTHVALGLHIVILRAMLVSHLGFRPRAWTTEPVMS